MQEGILSLMQMPRTTVGVQMLREAKQPYIVVLTNPTTGGVTAVLCDAGRRADRRARRADRLCRRARDRTDRSARNCRKVSSAPNICATTGMVDMVVHRHEMRPTLARLCRLLTKSPALETPSKPRRGHRAGPDRIGSGIGAGRAHA
jgi:acetyl-CoA carboxylase carboxyl transferase subunit beta